MSTDARFDNAAIVSFTVASRIDAFSQLAGEERIRELAQQIRGFHQNNAGKSESER